jgi:hypothetical protein
MMRNFSIGFLLIGSVILLAGCPSTGGSQNPGGQKAFFHGGPHLPIDLEITGDDIVSTDPSPSPSPSPTPIPENAPASIPNSNKVKTKKTLPLSPFTTIIQLDKTTKDSTFTVTFSNQKIQRDTKLYGSLSGFSSKTSEKSVMSSEYEDGINTEDWKKKFTFTQDMNFPSKATVKIKDLTPGKCYILTVFYEEGTGSDEKEYQGMIGFQVIDKS